MINDFQQSLKAEGKSLNTISFYMRTLRAIYNRAIDEGRIRRRIENIFAGVYTGVAQSRKLALTSNELARLIDADTAKTLPDTLQQSLAMFLFCYHARGMCFVDMAHLKKNDISENTIRYRRKKTGQTLEVKIVPAMRRILNRFAATKSEYIFPIITESNKDPRLQYESGLRLQNKRLKKIAALLNINKPLSTHVSRHSWATVAKNEGLPLAVISEGLGHSSQRTTEIYLASLEQSHLDYASIVVSEAICGSRHTKGKTGRKRNRSPDVNN
jgi:integrase